MDNAGSDVSSSQEASLIGSMIVIINSLTLIWPIARKVLTGKHLEYYEKLQWVLGLPHGCYMKYCGGEKRAAAAREREKQARAERRRASGVRRQDSLAQMEVAGTAGVRVDLVLPGSPLQAASNTGSLRSDHSDGAVIQGQDDAVSQPVPPQTRDLEPAADASRGHAGVTWERTLVPDAVGERERKKSVSMCLEKILHDQNPGPATLHRPVPFKELTALLQTQMQDLDPRELRGFLEQCDTDKDGRVSLAELSVFLRAEPHYPTPNAACKSFSLSSICLS